MSSKRLVVNLSETLYNELNETLKKNSKKKSEFIAEALILYIEEIKKINLIDQMKNGYADMANLNLEISEFGFDNYVDELKDYETHLSESDLPDDNNSSEKRRYILC